MSTISNASYISLPALPRIVTEWCALVPLVVHLASPHDEFQVIGDACLRGKIRLDLMPKLGQLKGVAKLLSFGSAVLDQTSSAGVAGSMTVWDVSWGSVFQCANGAARELLTAHAFRRKTDVVEVETTAPEAAGDGRQPQTKVDGREPATKPSIPKNVAFSRPQVLHLVELRFDKTSSGSKGSTTPSLVERLCTVLGHVLATAPILPLALCGAYGTCALLLLSRVNALVCQRLPIHRPPGYLGNTETYNSACMLVAPHDNASTWHLYRGDRAVVDWLLNKPMLAIRTPRGWPWAFWYFQLTHYLQLLAMTYVAAQKGWDGVFLLVLMVISRLAGSDAAAMTPWAARAGGAAAIWLRQNNINIEVNTFRMTGRTQMIGAIELINGMDQSEGSSPQSSSSSLLSSSTSSSASLIGNHQDTGSHGTSASSSIRSHTLSSMGSKLRANWMDSIIAQSPRRDMWLERLSTTMLAKMQQLTQPILTPDVATPSIINEILEPANIPTLNPNLVQQLSNPVPETGDAQLPSSNSNELSDTIDRPGPESVNIPPGTDERQDHLVKRALDADAPSLNVQQPSGPEAGGSAGPDFRLSSTESLMDVKWVDQNALWAWETARCIIQSCAAAPSIETNPSQSPGNARMTAVQA
ncbi:uncharacterized protein PV07_05669 [Cladophialophora immunda]|uniref:Uncharacterized protein n=1 Tax=Cladophialophora immunda TaxID=569365 RepID=A0A0D2CFJ2_9EURO|nr:uncharacterized protein PV07_05669 [Cladophialophora immunda]KIW29883.1 hypothetical protein PV07_05669 [Cladophialophora immunda]